MMLLQGVVLLICIALFAGSVVALGAIVSAKPLDVLDYKGWTGGQNRVTSPYASSVYIGWAMASAIALLITGSLPIVSWFATYRFSLSSAICIGIFVGNVFVLYHSFYSALCHFPNCKLQFPLTYSLLFFCL